MRKLIPWNTDRGGQSECAKTVLAGYYKFGCATLLGETFGVSGTVVLEISDENNTDKHR